jgi:hypothetical protein
MWSEAGIQLIVHGSIRITDPFAPEVTLTTVAQLWV